MYKVLTYTEACKLPDDELIMVNAALDKYLKEQQPKKGKK